MWENASSAFQSNKCAFIKQTLNKLVVVSKLTEKATLVWGNEWKEKSNGNELFDRNNLF